MAIAAGFLSILVIGLILYFIFILRQLRSINRQLSKRLSEQTRQPISLQLVSKELNDLAIHINQCLQAEETLRLKGIREEKSLKEMITNISHDLRTPLTAIKGYHQLLAQTELSDDQQKKLEIAQKHANELGLLVERFFEYSYLVNAEPALDRKRINLTNLVAECLAASVPVLEEHKLAVQLEESPPIYVLADQERITRIIHNLIRNAIQHSAGTLHVSLYEADQAILSFRNSIRSGYNIDVKRLFDRFYTGDQARSSSTGLGLSIVKLLAEQLGGSTDAALQDGCLEIRVHFPLCRNEH
ncbi:sensor histidine kinase [Paenibacillus aceti]|uniref:histidine kinase n=1 Tax=Paenibacillus aceti TaxID=1820010 RepID=A0ABQ1W221_9BACL|nr:HAMP domain-containing sensor histidine kinase [Paenibacillus aceti]GGG08950.1 two-component sensor histidine kinase [Paenibacillus aceti]